MNDVQMELLKSALSLVVALIVLGLGWVLAKSLRLNGICIRSEGRRTSLIPSSFIPSTGSSTQIIGSTRYHDIVADIDRVEIGYTWYSKSWQRSHVNTGCKLLLLAHAFDALGCKVVGLRTDNFNFASQRVIEALGAKKDGVIRHHWARRDGSVRDSVMYSILVNEWPDTKRHLEFRLAHHGRTSS